jgi:hypothetical protein
MIRSGPTASADDDDLRLPKSIVASPVVRASPSGYTDLLIECCRQAGFEPDIRRNPIQGTPPVTAVQGTRDLALVTAAAGPAAGGTVRVLELLPPTFVPLHALWPQHTNSPAREDFLAAATEA